MRKYECTKISEQETKCEIVYNDKYEEPRYDKYESITPSSNYSVAELKRYTYLINQDRKAFNVQPVLLGNNKLADDHAIYLWEGDISLNYTMYGTERCSGRI